MPSVNDLLKKQHGKAKKLGITTKKIKRDGPTRPWEIKESDFKRPTGIDSNEKTPATSLDIAPQAEQLSTSISPPSEEQGLNSVVDSTEKMARHSSSNGMPNSDEAPKVARQTQHRELFSISTKHLRLLAYFRKICGSSNQAGPINYFILAQETNLPERSLKRYVKDLKARGIIEKVVSGWQSDGTQGSLYFFDIRLMNDALSLSFLTGQNGMPQAGHFRRSSSNYINTTTTIQNGMPSVVEEVDLSKLPGIDR